MKKMYETAMINRGGRDGEVEAPNGSMHMKSKHGYLYFN